MSPTRHRTRNDREREYDLLIARDGPLCTFCRKTPPSKRGHHIDHRDNDAKNNDLTNKQILCKGCNITKRNLVQAGLPHDVKAVLAARHASEERGSASTPAPTTHIYIASSETAKTRHQETSQERDEVYRKAPEPLQRRDRFIPLFEVFINVNLVAVGQWEKTDFLGSCSVFTGASPTWVKGEVARQLTTLGSLRQFQDNNGDWWIARKEKRPEATNGHRNGHSDPTGQQAARS